MKYCSMAAGALMPQTRLHGKQPAAKTIAKGARDRKGKASVRKVAVQEGAVPKARRPFALFMSEHNRVQKGASKEAHQQEMRRLGRLWRLASEGEKNKYKRRCKEEFSAQRDAMKIIGLPLRQTEGKAQQLQPSQPQEPVSEMQSAAQKLAKFGQITVLQDEKPLGEGSYGTVPKGLTPCGCLCALKLFRGVKQTSLEQEVMVFKLIEEKLSKDRRHLFPRLLAAELVPKPFCYLALEFGGASVDHVLNTQGVFEERSMKCLALQLRSALQALHSIRILHLDLKPANILWSAETQSMKLTDFGLVELIGTEAAALRLHEYVSAPYRPPELWNASPNDIAKHLRPSIDIWSFGCVLFECSAATILMKPSPPSMSSQSAVNVWCKSWEALGSKSTLKLEASAQRMKTRLLRAGPWGDRILECLNPDPASRTWSGLTFSL